MPQELPDKIKSITLYASSQKSNFLLKQANKNLGGLMWLSLRSLLCDSLSLFLFVSNKYIVISWKLDLTNSSGHLGIVSDDQREVCAFYWLFFVDNRRVFSERDTDLDNEWAVVVSNTIFDIILRELLCACSNFDPLLQ